MKADILADFLGGDLTLEDVQSEANKIAQGENAADYERQLADARVFADCFETPAGKKCLELMMRQTIFMPPGQAELSAKTVEEYALIAARRDGVRTFVFKIVNALDTARGVDEAEQGEQA